MRNISSDLSSEKHEPPEVEVLLATFNGGVYLGEFLDSLLKQEGVRIHLRVSDDGSTDKTLEIIRSYETKFESCKIFKGPAKGPSANFFSLLDKATHNFVALADQDDLWEKDKLSTQISFIVGNVPQMVCHDRSIIDSKGSKLIDSQINVRLFGLKNALIENVVFGNTILLNKQGVELLKNYRSPNMIMYDAYIYLVFSCLGKTNFIQKPLTKYRIHDHNYVGIPGNFKRIRKFRLYLQSIYKQNKTFFQLYMKDIDKADAEIFTKFFQISENRNRILRFLSTLRAPISRQKTYETIIWKILVIIYDPKPRDFDNFTRNSSM